MTSVRNRLVLILTALLALSGCAGMDNYIQQPTVVFKGVSIDNPSMVAATLAFQFEVTNPTPIPLSMAGIRYKLALNEAPFLEDRLAGTLAVPASGSSTVTVPIPVKYLDLFNTAVEMFKNDSIRYALSGGIEIGPLIVPFQKSGSVPLPKRPTLRLASMRVTNLSFTGATVRFGIGIDNPNAFPLAMAGLAYAIAIDGIHLAEGRTTAVPTVSANGRSEVPIELALNFLSVGRSVQRLLRGDAADYRISGDMQIPLPGGGVKALPFTHQGQVPLVK